MAEQTWLESTEQLLAHQPKKGLLHYADIAAALAEQDPERFAPAPRRVTPHFTVWRTLDEADDFEKVGGGWFAYHPWGAVGDEKLQLSSDGGKALRQAVAALKEAAGTTSSALDELLGDAEWCETEALLRKTAMERAREILQAGELDGGRVGELLSEWSKCGGRKPGVVQKNRFAPAFIGIYVQKYREQVDLLNDWVGALREAVDAPEKVASALDTLWGRGDLAFAGTILPTTVLYTLNPETWFPWTDTLARGLRSALDVGSGRADGSGEGYLTYCAGVRDYLDREGLSPHLADVALTRESLQASVPVKKARRRAEVGFGPEGFELLGEIATTDGANAEWFADRRVIYRDQVRLPLAALVERVAREVIQPVVNDGSLLGEDTVVVETKRVLARINAQSPRANGSMYYPYLWGAFFPTSQLRRQTASQLFLTVHPDGVDVGLALDSGPSEARQRFETCVSGGEVAERLEHWLATDGSILELRRFSLDGGPSIESTSIDSVEDLKAISSAEGGWALVFRLSAAEAREKDVGDAVERATRALLPFFLLGLTDEPSTLLDRLGLPGLGSEEEPDEADKEEAQQIGYSLDQLQADTHLEKAWLQEVALAATFDGKRRGAPGQIVLYGPPGTGKTFLAEQVALHLVDGDPKRVEVVQLHPAFSYEHLIEGYRPREQDGALLFRIEDGILPKLLARIRQSGKRHVLVLDEMNRGDLPQILGELMYLLSRRGTGAEVQLARSGKPLSLPDRLSIIGTMNTADRSIAHVDFALRRRFRFFRVQPSAKVIESLVGQQVGPDWAASLSSLLSETNERLSRCGRGFEIGHSYFLEVDDEQALQEVWDREILPSIEDWLDFDPVAMRPFSWENTRKRLRHAIAVRAGEEDAVIEPDLEDDES